MNMKILYISTNRINEKTGGGLEAKKIFLALKYISKKDTSKKLYTVSLDDKPTFSNKHIKISKNRFKDFSVRLLGHSSYIFFEWNKIKNFINEIKPDVIILGNSRMGFMAKKIKTIKNIFIIGHFDNIELEYLEPYSLKYRPFIANIFRVLEGICVKRDEKEMIKNMDIGLFLTKRDVENAHKYYHQNFKYKIIPICLEKPDWKLRNNNQNDLNLIFLGSLWYGSNINALKWFLENVWRIIIKKYDKVNFIIGGSKPTDDFLYYLKTFPKVSIFPNFMRKEDIIPLNSYFISPVQKGAGMKVKIAEALSMGLGIIGSDESIIGYEEAFIDKLNKNVIRRANKPEEFIFQIDNIIKNRSYNLVRENAIYLFDKYYSQKRMIRDFESMIDNLVEK